MNRPNILIIEDDKVVSRLMATMMESQDYAYQLAETGRDGIAAILSYKPEVILLDLGLPDMDGVDIIEQVRGWSNVPIIVVSAREDDSDKVKALDAGADDYLTKPFSIDELLARLRVALRRVALDSDKSGIASNIYENGNLRIDYSAGCAYINGEEIHLTPMEYKLLCLLAKNTGKVLTYNYILKEIWGSINASDIPSLRVFMTALRKKIQAGSDKEFIQTHSGIGYRMLHLH
ncbi:MAG: response regulator transcription factor [Clostridiales bacterium]|nr:response regulator transcription factor [Candidatus Crickella equi]